MPVLNQQHGQMMTWVYVLSEQAGTLARVAFCAALLGARAERLLQRLIQDHQQRLAEEAEQVGVHLSLAMFTSRYRPSISLHVCGCSQPRCKAVSLRCQANLSD